MSRLRHDTMDLNDLATEPAGDHAALLTLPGRVRGRVLGPWGENLNRRHGPNATALIRADLGVEPADLPDKPADERWLPGGLQIALTDAIADRFYGGDLRQLEAPVLEDAARPVGRVARLALRGLGPARLLEKAGALHAHTWDVGTIKAEVGADQATLLISGCRLFTDRTWLALQLVALRGTVELTGRTLVTRSATRLAADRAQLHVRWC